MAVVRLCHLYPHEMNIYADRGNIAVFRQRLAWRGHDLEITEVAHGDAITPGAHDLYYLGGGQDRDQRIVAHDLAETKADALKSAAEDGAAFLWVCGGIQLAGVGYTDASGERLPGVGILDLDTEAGDRRMIGDIVLLARLDGEVRRVVGYENHVGRTMLGPDATWFGRVEHGHGNDGESGHEGAVQNHVIGTYLHGCFAADAFRRDFLASIGASAGEVNFDQAVDQTLDALAEHIIAFADRPIFIDQEFWNSKQRNAAGASGRIGQAGQNEMNDVF